MGIFIRWEDFLANKIFVHMLSSLETLEFGINKLFFPVKKKSCRKSKDWLPLKHF